MPVSNLHHKNHRIVYADYSSCKSVDEMIEVLEALKRQVVASESSDIRNLNNYEGISLTRDFAKFMDRGKEYGAKYFSQRVKKAAIIGLPTLGRVFLSSYKMISGQKNMNVFSSKDEALDWLASD